MARPVRHQPLLVKDADGVYHELTYEDIIGPPGPPGSGGAGSVASVNGQIGVVTLTASDVGAPTSLEFSIEVASRGDADAVLSGRIDTEIADRISAVDTKVTKSGVASSVYGTNGSGAEVLYPVASSFAGPNTIPVRSSAGRLTATAGSVSTDVATKGQMDTALANKVSRDSSSSAKVYGTDGSGTETSYNIATAATVRTVAYRGTDGTVLVQPATAAGHAVQKAQLDSTVATINSRIDNVATGGGARMQYTQATPAAVWSFTYTGTIPPNVMVVDSSMQKTDADIQLNTSTQNITITFGAPVSGIAYLS